MKKLAVYLLLLSLLTSTAYAEGTRELSGNNLGRDIDLMLVTNPNSENGNYNFNNDSTATLNVRIAGTQEVLYMGFRTNRSNGGAEEQDVWVRVRRSSDNTIVYGPARLAPVGTCADCLGWIPTKAEAFEGPEAVVGTGDGYDEPIVLTNLQHDDYIIEFAYDNNPTNYTTRAASWFDVTVHDPTIDPGAAGIIPGRLWSRAWALNTTSGGEPFDGTLYPYSRDSVVTSVDFNGMRPWGFVVACNSFGVRNDLGQAQNRQSDYHNDLINAGVTPGSPEYPIFLNDPDEDEFPSGGIGSLDGLTVQPCASNAYCINVAVSKPSQVELFLTFLEDPSVPGSFDGVRTIIADLEAGDNCVPFDGRDAFGREAVDGQAIDIQLAYQTGLTHLPLRDVERHDNGYSVQLVRPDTTLSGNPLLPPNLYWDHRNIAGGGINPQVNLTGEPQSPPPPGGSDNTWAGLGNNSNQEWMNTWWFVNEDADSIILDVDSTTWQVFSDVSIDDNCIVGDEVTLDIRFVNTAIDIDSVSWALNTNFPNLLSFNNADTTVNGDTTAITVTYDVLDTTNIDNLILFFDVSASSSTYPFCETSDGQSCVLATLPVELLGFTATPVGTRDVQLNWLTANEVNNMGFAIERRTDLSDWQQIDFVEANPNTYRYLDKDLSPDTYYYRLRQMDLDGQTSYSPTVEATIYNSGDIIARSVAGQIQITNAYNETQYVDLYDLTGRLIAGYDLQAGASVSLEQSNGMYLIRWADGAEKLHHFTN